MRITQVGPGYVHTPKALQITDEYEQMTAARLMPIVVQGKAAMRWITPAGKREEGGDCMVYAYAAACHLGIQTYREPGWARREAKFSPREPDLFAPTKNEDGAQIAVKKETTPASIFPKEVTPARSFSRDW
jgi:phage terminase large subunit GpA-like protein